MQNCTRKVCGCHVMPVISRKNRRHQDWLIKRPATCDQGCKFANKLIEVYSNDDEFALAYNIMSIWFKHHRCVFQIVSFNDFFCCGNHFVQDIFVILKQPISLSVCTVHTHTTLHPWPDFLFFQDHFNTSLKNWLIDWYKTRPFIRGLTKVKDKWHQNMCIMAF